MSGKKSPQTEHQGYFNSEHWREAQCNKNHELSLAAALQNPLILLHSVSV